MILKNYKVSDRMISNSVKNLYVEKVKDINYVRKETDELEKFSKKWT